MANSFSWDIGMDFVSAYPGEKFTDATHDTGPDRIFDVAVLSDHLGHPLVDSPRSQRPLGKSLKLDGFQPLPQAQYKLGEPSSNTQVWEQNLTSSPDAMKPSNHLSKPDSPVSEQQRKEAYFQLEIFYRFKPDLTEAQIEALAVVVELSCDEVQAFYQQKKSQPPSYVFNGSTPRHGQGLRPSHPAKRSRGSESSSSPETIQSTYGPSRSDSSVSLQTSERGAIPRTPSLNRQIREPSQKPYECTWRVCSMSFASKSDWKRHEEVHCPQWEWICTFESWPAENSSNAIPCARLPFKRSDHLREHLRKDHKCIEVSKVEAGRQCITPQNSFNRQCGFCGYITRGWLDRIDHIAEHFRNGKSMSEWTGPWPDDVFEERSPSNDDDDNGNGDADGMDNHDSTLPSQDHAGNGSGNDNKNNVNKDPPSGSYQGYGNGYRRPGTLAVKYHASIRAPEVVQGVQRRDNEAFRPELESCNSFWSRMRNTLKNRNARKEPSSSISLQATKPAISEGSPESDRQDGERTEFYCILCTKRVSTDPTLPTMEDYRCTCSEAAIKEHIMSVALGGLHLDTPSTKSSGEVAGSEQQSQKNEKTVISLTVEARERGLARTKSQCRAILEQADEQLSYSIQRYLKTLPASESLPELDQDENSWIKIRPQDLAGAKQEEHAEPYFLSSQQETFSSGKLGHIMGRDRILNNMQSLPDLRRRRTTRDR